MILFFVVDFFLGVFFFGEIEVKDIDDLYIN